MAVFGGAVGGSLAGGPVGAIGGAISAGAAMDGVHTGVDVIKRSFAAALWL